jgi:hypothetical protein
MRKLDMSEHYDPLRIVSSDPSIYYVHVPSPRGVLIEMSRGTVYVFDPLGAPMAMEAVYQVFYRKPLRQEDSPSSWPIRTGCQLDTLLNHPGFFT